jgi:uncharacterized membrane protein
MTSNTQDYRVLMAVFSNEADANAAVDALVQMADAGTISLADAAVVSRGDDGKVRVNDLADKKKRGWGTGATAGAVVGVIFPPSIIAGAVVGGAAGGLYHRFRDKGFSNKQLEKAGESLDMGQWAIVAVGTDKLVSKVATGIEGYEHLSETLFQADAGVLAAP